MHLLQERSKEIDYRGELNARVRKVEAEKNALLLQLEKLGKEKR
jgi:hypothetical protein